eukprot:TRINITY_DN27778_c0_g1_i1.p1 TRINITY_DN27778_c0_g1~~TRINITY_DN27778_c0_g1_i1.p1  ORF type:complete len:533 (-),score=121.28 TRINITY_DN27778_c0_g1_i1:230-1828(-)
MEWFRQFQPQCPGDNTVRRRDSASSQFDLDVLLDTLPCREGLLVGHLKSIKANTKDGLITCGAVSEQYGSSVFIYRDILSSCGASIGDRLAFRIHENDQGQPQAEGPVWREVTARLTEAKRFAEETFPTCIGVLASVTPSGDSGAIESPRERHGRELYVPRALLAGLSEGDTVACNVRLNGKGNPQAAEPVFRLCVGRRRARTSSSQDAPGSLAVVAAPAPPQPARPSRAADAACSAALAGAVADWENFPVVLLPRTLAAAGAAELIRLPTVCRSWTRTIAEAAGELEGFWEALCAELYPAMVAKVLGSEQEQRRAAAEEDGAPAPPEAREAWPEATSAPVEPAVVPGAWRNRFVQRHKKQLQWDAEKKQQQRQRQERLQQQQGQMIHEDKQRGQNAAKSRRGQERNQSSASDGNTQRSLRAVRVKTCRRCGERYMPGLTEGCHWHRGQYVPVADEDTGVPSSDEDGHGAARTAAPAGAPAGKKVQQLLKAAARKRRGKQQNVGFADGDRFAWSCCGATNLVAPGCASGPHT